MKNDDELLYDPYIVGRITQLSHVANNVPKFTSNPPMRIVEPEEMMLRRIEKLEERVKTLEKAFKNPPIDKMKIWGPP